MNGYRNEQRRGNHQPENRPRKRRSVPGIRKGIPVWIPIAVWFLTLTLAGDIRAANFWALSPENRSVTGILSTEQGVDEEGLPYSMYVLQPDRPLAIAADGMEGEQVRKLQLAPDSEKASSLNAVLGRKVTVTGSVFAARNPSHHTPLVMLVSHLEAAPTVGDFLDVYTTDYYASAVQWAIRRHITTGTSETTFSPGDGVTLDQAVTFLWRAAGSPAPKAPNLLRGIDQSQYYYKPALWALEQGLISGLTFDPARRVTRGQVITWMWKLEGSPVTGTNPFMDIPFGAEYARAAAWACSKGVATGRASTSFGPDQVCTRGQMVTFLYRNR